MNISIILNSNTIPGLNPCRGKFPWRSLWERVGANHTYTTRRFSIVAGTHFLPHTTPCGIIRQDAAETFGSYLVKSGRLYGGSSTWLPAGVTQLQETRCEVAAMRTCTLWQSASHSGDVFCEGLVFQPVYDIYFFFLISEKRRFNTWFISSNMSYPYFKKYGSGGLSLVAPLPEMRFSQH